MKSITIKSTPTRRALRSAMLAAVAGLVPMAAAHAVSPLGFEIPTSGTPGPLPRITTAAPSAPRGVSPLGWEIPPPTPRGVQKPLRSDAASQAVAPASPALSLGGIGGTDTD